MADEENENMEKLLRAYAEARRKGAQLPLHPATRKMLQAEAARRFKNSEREFFWSRWRTFWPQLAFGSGLCAILLVAIISLRHPPKAESQLERQTAAPGTSIATNAFAAAADTELSAEAANAAPKKPASVKENAASEPQTETMDRRDLTIVPTPAAPQLSVAAREEEQLAKLKDANVLQEQKKTDLLASSVPQTLESRVLQLQESAPAQQASASIARYSYTRADRLTNLGDALRLQFVSVPNRDQPPATQLLNTFQLEQQGDDVRITDRDGSVYLGQLFPEPPGQGTNVLSFSEVAARGLGAAENSQGASVQLLFAQGTNRTLAKPVRLEGRYLERTNPVEVGRATSAPMPAAKSASTPAMKMGRGRYSVVGKAIIGQTNEVPLNAVSVEPGK